MGFWKASISNSTPNQTPEEVQKLTAFYQKIYNSIKTTSYDFNKNILFMGGVYKNIYRYNLWSPTKTEYNTTKIPAQMKLCDIKTSVELSGAKHVDIEDSKGNPGKLTINELDTGTIATSTD